MDLWIRSQDKELLVNSKGFELQQHYENSPCQIFAVWNNNYMCVGTYKTKERALEVLDEIQKKINLINLGHDFGSPMVDLKNPSYIYEMPEK